MMNARHFAAATAAAFLLPLAAQAIALYGVEAYTVPDRIYVGQPFELRLDIVADQNAEISAKLPTGINGDIDFDLPRPVGVKTRKNQEGVDVFVHTIAFDGVAAAPVSNDIRNSRTTVSVTERRSVGFGSSQFTRSGVAPVSWKPFEILPLPTEGRPEGFAGAVGNFRLQMTASPVVAAPGDIVKLTVAIHGNGTLGNARPALPNLPPALFKVYPSEEAENRGNALATVTASIVPLSTQSVEVAAATFDCFDAASGTYRTVQSNPVRLVVREHKAEAVPAVRTLDLTGAKPAVATGAVEMVQLYLAPARTSLKTFLVPSSEKTAVLEETPDGLWRRVKILSTGSTGWLQP